MIRLLTSMMVHKYYKDVKCITGPVCGSIIHVLYVNTDATKMFIPLKTKLRHLVLTSVYSCQYVVMHRSSYTSALVPKCPGPKTEVSWPMVRTISALGPECFSVEMSWCRPVPKCFRTLGHRCRSVWGLNCLGSDVSISAGSGPWIPRRYPPTVAATAITGLVVQ